MDSKSCKSSLKNVLSPLMRTTCEMCVENDLWNLIIKTKGIYLFIKFRNKKHYH